MALGYFVTHPDVVIDPAKPIERWSLSPRGRERMRALLEQPWLSRVGRVLSSSEQKTLDGAEILVSALGLPHEVVAELGEYDRSSTGLLPPSEFWSLVDEFFRKPTERSAAGSARWTRRRGCSAPCEARYRGRWGSDAEPRPRLRGPRRRGRALAGEPFGGHHLARVRSTASAGG